MLRGRVANGHYVKKNAETATSHWTTDRDGKGEERASAILQWCTESDQGQLKSERGIHAAFTRQIVFPFPGAEVEYLLRSYQ